MSSNSSASPSIMIPRVFPNIGERRIRGVFGSLDLGTISRVDFVERTAANGDKFNMVFIHFESWNTTPDAEAAKAQLLEEKEPLIIEYDDPWFWKCYLNKGKKQTRQGRPAPKLKLAAPDLDSKTQFPPPASKLTIDVTSPQTP